MSFSPQETSVDAITEDIYRISTAIAPSNELPAGFSFNQYLIVDDEPLLYHTGLRSQFAATRQALEKVLEIERLRFIAFSHVEADECGALNEFLAEAPNAQPLCGEIAAMTSVGDLADRPPRALADRESLKLGRHIVTWMAAPHLPHGWECGHLFDETTRTLFCGDLFTQFGAECPAVTTEDILERSEQARQALDYYSHTTNCAALIEQLASLEPRILACMHGSAWAGNGGGLLRELGQRLIGS